MMMRRWRKEEKLCGTERLRERENERMRENVWVGKLGLSVEMCRGRNWKLEDEAQNYLQEIDKNSRRDVVNAMNNNEKKKKKRWITKDVWQNVTHGKGEIYSNWNFWKKGKKTIIFPTNRSEKQTKKKIDKN